MKLPVRVTLPVLACAVLAAACGRSGDEADWPPFKNRLTTFFADHQASLQRLERAMASDGYQRMNAAIVSGEVSHPSLPSLGPEQSEKYRNLLQATDAQLSVRRKPGTTEFELLSEPVDTRLYVFRFIHGAPAEDRVDCDAGIGQQPCGRCTIGLDRDWRLEYDWFPQDLDVEASKCR